MTDPDSVEITFVFRNSGGYVLAISPEYSRLERRCLGFDRAHQAVAFAPTWFKPIDSVNPLLRQFRRYCSSPIAPFLFTGSTYIGPRGVLTPTSTPDVHAIPGLEPLLKFEGTFIDEAAVTPDSIGWLALKVGATPKTKLAEIVSGTSQPLTRTSDPAESSTGAAAVPSRRPDSFLVEKAPSDSTTKGRDLELADTIPCLLGVNTSFGPIVCSASNHSGRHAHPGAPVF